jgi:hypothetical protein
MKYEIYNGVMKNGEKYQHEYEWWSGTVKMA